MRHVVSLLLGLVSAPLIWLCTGIGLARAGTDADPPTDRALVGYGLLLIAGAAYAALLVSRVSPLGPVLAGAALLGAALWELFDRPAFDRLLTTWSGGGDLALPAQGFAALLAVPLLATAFRADRWRRPVPVPVAPLAAQPPGTPYPPAPPWDPTGYPYGSPTGPHPLAATPDEAPAAPPAGYPPLQRESTVDLSPAAADDDEPTRALAVSADPDTDEPTRALTTRPDPGDDGPTSAPADTGDDEVTRPVVPAPHGGERTVPLQRSARGPRPAGSLHEETTQVSLRRPGDEPTAPLNRHEEPADEATRDLGADRAPAPGGAPGSTGDGVRGPRRVDQSRSS